MRRREADHRSGMLITTINGTPVALHWMARALQDAGFQAAPLGFNLRRILMPVSTTAETPASEVQ
jgi:ATP-dependent Lhr-like helicase